MTAQADLQRVIVEAERIRAEIERLWPAVSAEVALDTYEDEDAYVWITVPDDDFYDVLMDASAMSVDLFNETGIYVLPMTMRKGASG